MLTQRRLTTWMATAAVVVSGGLAVTASPATAADGERVVLTEDFSGGMPQGWQPIEGAWTVADGKLKGVGVGGQLARITFGPHLEAYRFEATVRFEKVENASRWASLGLDVAADGSVPWWIATMRSTTTAPNGLEFAERTVKNGWNVTDTAAAPTDAATGKDVKVKVEVKGSRASWFFNGTKIMDTRHLVRSDKGGLAFLTSGTTVTFDDVKVTEIPNTADSLLRGPGEEMAVIAHRGYSQVAPEDTMAAYESAARAGADFLENDVQSTADGLPMILHDATVNRTTNGTGTLAALQSSYVLGLDAGTWFSKYFAGQRVPTSLEMLEHAKSKGKQVLLEIKGPETRTEIARILKDVNDSQMKESTVIQSFDPNILRTVHELDPSIRLGLLVSTVGADPVAEAKAAFASTYNPAWGALAGKKDVVDKLHAQGIAVQPWTVDDPRQWEAMEQLGVDGVITNRPGALIGWQVGYTAPAAPTVAFLSPAPGATFTRGQAVVPALDATGASSVALSLDGKAVTEGSPIDVDGLSLGAHTLTATVTGPGGKATATTTFTVAATREGLLHLAIDPRIPENLSGNLVQRILKGDWKSVIVQSQSKKIPADLGALIRSDAEALLAR